jgi:hypothetical protein
VDVRVRIYKFHPHHGKRGNFEEIMQLGLRAADGTKRERFSYERNARSFVEAAKNVHSPPTYYISALASSW